MPASFEAVSGLILLTFELKHTHFPITTESELRRTQKPCSYTSTCPEKNTWISETQASLTVHLSTEQQCLRSTIFKWTYNFKDPARHYLSVMTERRLISLNLKPEVQKMCPTYESSAASENAKFISLHIGDDNSNNYYNKNKR